MCKREVDVQAGLIIMPSGSKDPLDSEVSIKAKIDHSGVAVTTKSRLMAAVDYLFGALVDMPGGSFGGIAERNRLRSGRKTAALLAGNEAAKIEDDTKAALLRIASEAKIAIAEKQAEALVERATAAITETGELPALQREQAQLLLTDWAADRASRFENKFAVAAEAIEVLEAETAGTEATERPAPLEFDWLNVFGSHAEKATGEHLRSLWARILAGEVRNPGAFSLRTLRFVAELDRETAQRFERVLLARVGNDIPRPSDLQNDPLLQLVVLDEASLITGAAAPLGRTFTANDLGQVYIENGDFALVVEAEPGAPIRYPVSPLTRVGREIATIVAPADPRCGLTALSQMLVSSAKRIQLVQIIARRSDRSLVWRNEAELWKRPEDGTAVQE